jgi:hypothetical protein
VAFKLAVICPLLKKSNLDTTDVKNYRPISNLSVLSKLLERERVVVKQLMVHLDVNGLMADRQSACHAHHSTGTVLAKVLSYIFDAIDSGNLGVLSLLNLSAAINTIDHSVLLQ